MVDLLVGVMAMFSWESVAGILAFLANAPIRGQQETRQVSAIWSFPTMHARSSLDHFRLIAGKALNAKVFGRS